MGERQVLSAENLSGCCCIHDWLVNPRDAQWRTCLLCGRVDHRRWFWSRWRPFYLIDRGPADGKGFLDRNGGNY